jgi:hypothetical protein
MGELAMFQNQDLVRRARSVLQEDRAAEQAYRQLEQDLRDPSADVVFGLLVRETEEHCELLRRIIDGNLDDVGASAPANDDGRFKAARLDIQELARGSRRHAEQLRDLACVARGHGRAPSGAILDALARDSDKHASLLLELARGLGLWRQQPGTMSGVSNHARVDR